MTEQRGLTRESPRELESRLSAEQIEWACRYMQANGWVHGTDAPLWVWAWAFTEAAKSPEKRPVVWQSPSRGPSFSEAIFGFRL